MTSVVIDVERVPFPTARAILWAPRLVALSRGRREGARLCVTQEVLARLERDVVMPGHPGLGFLLGSAFHCPLLDVDYGVVDSVQAWPRSKEMSCALPPIDELQSVARAAAAGSGRALLGWFQVQALIRPKLSRDHVRVHHHLLAEGWQSTLILAPGPDGPTGCFFATDEAGVSPVPAEFHELVSVEDDGAARKHSCVTWSAYVAAEQVTTRRPAERRIIAARALPSWPSGEATTPVPEPLATAALEMLGHAGEERPESPTEDAAAATVTPAATAPGEPIRFPLYVPPRSSAQELAAEGEASARGRWWRWRLGAMILALFATLTLAGTVR